MIFETPIQSEGLYKLIEGADNPRDWPIRKHYPGFESTFLLFHPFLRIKKGQNLIKFEKETGLIKKRFQSIVI